MNRIATALWGLLIIISYALVVPLLVALLRRALAAARNIERYTADILASGGGIAENTGHVAALKETIAAAPSLVAAAESLGRHASTIKGALLANGDGNADGTEAKL